MKVAIASCLFNFSGDPVFAENWDRCLDGLRKTDAPVYMAELVNPDCGPCGTAADVHLTFDTGDVLWQKEALLNAAIRRIREDGYDAVAWIDADVIYHDPAWFGALQKELEKFDVIQCIDSCCAHFSDRKLNTLGAVRSFLRHGNVQSHPGACWAALLDAIPEGLFDCMQLADRYMWYGFLHSSQKLSATRPTSKLNDALRERYVRWVHTLRVRNVSFLNYQAHLLAHGPYRKRKYLIENQFYLAHFDPAFTQYADEEAGCGPKVFTDVCPPEIKLHLQEYFGERRDGSEQDSTYQQPVPGETDAGLQSPAGFKFVTLPRDTAPLDVETLKIPESLPVLPIQPAVNMAVVACVFNPNGHQSFYQNWKQCSQRLEKAEAPVYLVELLYGNQQPRCQVLGNVTHVVVEGGELLWQKEALLNVGIRQATSDGYDAVAWIDGDMVYDDESWFRDAEDLLQHHDVVQCFDQIISGYTDKIVRASGAVRGYYHNRTLNGHPGGCWAARVEVIPDGLFPYMMAADRYMWYGFVHSMGLRDVSSRWNFLQRPMFKALSDWVDGLQVRDVGFLPTYPQLLVHGSHESRQYVEQDRFYSDHFDPDYTVIKESGCLGFSETCPDYVRDHLQAYFLGRNDGNMTRSSVKLVEYGKAE